MTVEVKSPYYIPKEERIDIAAKIASTKTQRAINRMQARQIAIAIRMILKGSKDN